MLPTPLFFHFKYHCILLLKLSPVLQRKRLDEKVDSDEKADSDEKGYGESDGDSDGD